MRPMPRFIAVLPLVFYLAGCAVPGTSMSEISVRGALQSDAGQPLAGASGEVFLHSAEGLDKLDLAEQRRGDPWLGESMKKIPFTADAQGAFAENLGYFGGHATCWMFPPIGCHPAENPVMFLRMNAAPDEYYAIQIRNGRFMAFGSDGQVLPPQQARLSQVSTHREKGETGKTIDVLTIKMQVK